MVVQTCVRNYLRSVKSDAVKNKVNFKQKKVVSEYIDSLRLKVIGGHGGNGCPVSKAIGGTGGNVIVQANDEVENLSIVKTNFPDLIAQATDGLDGRKTRLIGPNGSDCVVKVPCGVTVFSGHMTPLSDLVKPGDSKIVAHGGQGGTVRNNWFGIRGQSQTITLDLRYLVNLGLVGYPDSGKSLLLAKLASKSDQKLLSMDEPFTKKRPNLGDIKYDDSRLIKCIDLPSIVEGAHHKEGLGHHYLKHLTHNQMILFVLDVNGFNRGIYRKAIETLMIVNKQIEIYDDRFCSKPSIIAVNKMDSPNADVLLEEFLASLKKIVKGDFGDIEKSIRPHQLMSYQDVIPISSLHDRNIDYLKLRIRELIDFNYLTSRDPDSPRSFASLLERVHKLRTDSKAQLV